MLASPSNPEVPFLARLQRLNANALEAGREAEEQAQRQRRAPLLPIAERNTRAEAAHALLLALVAWVATHQAQRRSSRPACHTPRRAQARTHSQSTAREHKPP